MRFTWIILVIYLFPSYAIAEEEKKEIKLLDTRYNKLDDNNEMRVLIHADSSNESPFRYIDTDKLFDKADEIKKSMCKKLGKGTKIKLFVIVGADGTIFIATTSVNSGIELEMTCMKDKN